MKKFLVILILLIVNFSFSQIKLKIDDVRLIDENKYLLKISVINESKENYAVPIDTTGFRAYFSSKICPEFEDVEYPYLAPTILIEDDSNKQIIEGDIGNIGYLDDEAIAKINNGDIYRKINKDKLLLNQWMKKERISDSLKAKINMYIINNILLLKPLEVISYQILMDTSELRYSKNTLLHDRYNLKENMKYNLSLAICINQKIYHNLTLNQIEKFDGNTLFTGTIESNKVELKK